MPEDAGSIYSAVMLKLSELEKGVVKVSTILDGMNKKSQKQSSGFAGFWKNAFQTAFGFGIVQLINKVTTAVRGALSIFAGFQQSMRNVQSVTGATGEEFRQMTEAAKEAGETTRFTAREAADALYYLGSAGFSAQQSIAALDGVLQLAGATQSDLASTSESVAATISQYGLDASEAARVANVFTAAITNSQATMEKLTASFRQVGPVAAGFGYTLEDTVGALQELYNAGFQGQQAGRALKSALADLASPTANMEKILAKYNVELGKVNPATNEFSDIIDTLGNTGLTTADIIDAFGKVAGPQMAVLIREGGDALRKYTDDVTNTNAAAEAYQIQNDSLAGSMDFLKSKLESTAIAIFEKLEPGMRDLIDSFINFLDATRPVGELLGNILNIFFKLASFSTGAITKLFEGLLGQFEKSKTPLEKATINFEKVRKSIERAGEIDKTINNIDRLNKEYEELTSKTELSKEEQDRLKEIIRDIAKVVPEAVTSFDEYGRAIAISTEKTKESAKQLLETRRAVIMEAKARLDLEKPLLENLLRERGEEAKNLKEREKNVSKNAAIAEQRLKIISTFNQRYAKELKRLGGDEARAFRNIAVRLANDFRLAGIELKAFTSEVGFFLQDTNKLKVIAEQSERAIDELKKELAKESKVIIDVEDAEKKLEELAKLEAELKILQTGIKELEKIDPIADTALDDTDEILDFWTTYRNELEAATREASIFGDKQDVLKTTLDFLRNAYLDLIEEGMDPASETMQRIRQEYDLTLAELNALIEAEKTHTDVLKTKEEIQAEISDITADYYQKIYELGKSEKDLIEIEREKAKAIINGMGASNEATRAALEAIDIYYDKLKETSEETREDFKITFDQILGYAQQLAGALSSLFAEITQDRIDELDRQMQAELERQGLLEETERERLERQLQEAIDEGDTETAEQLQDDLDRLAIQEEYERQKALAEYQGALSSWRLQLSEAIATAAQAVLSGYSQRPFIPLGLTAGTMALALGGIQVGTVRKQKPEPPAFDTGGIYRNPEGSGMAILHDKEAVLNERQLNNLFNMINSGNGGSSPVNITNIVELEGIVIGRMIERMQQSGILKFSAKRLIP